MVLSVQSFTNHREGTCHALCVISLFGVRGAQPQGEGLAPTVFSCYVFAHAFFHISGRDSGRGAEPRSAKGDA